MNRVIALSDEHYRAIEQAAQIRGQTPDIMLGRLIEELRDSQSNPRPHETDDWLRHLGMSEETVRKIQGVVRSEQECPHDADA